MVEARNTTTIINICRGVRDDIVNLVEQYESVFGVGPVWVSRVPARLCLAADHTDYWQGFRPELLTMASDSQEMWGVIGARDDGLISCYSSENGFLQWEEKLGDNVPKGDDWLGWLESIETPPPHWSNYVMGSVKHTQMNMDVKFGFNIYISSSIPPASGASSSSALATTAMFATRLSNGLSTNFDDLVVATAEGEWYCGTRGGMMDHATMLNAETGKILRLCFEPFSVKLIQLPHTFSNHKFMTIFTHPSDKGGDTMLAFNELAVVAREIVPRFLENKWEQKWLDLVETLPEHITPIEIKKRWPQDYEKLCSLYPLVFKNEKFVIRVADRFRFAMREFERSKEMQSLLALNDCNPKDVANIMNESWKDAGDLYGIRTEKMDVIAEEAIQISGILGIKVLGAGFGGNLLALVEEKANVSELKKYGVQTCNPGSKASLFDVSELMPKLEKYPPIAAVLLCGGVGTRMLKQGLNTHKPLLQINNIPCTKFVISELLNGDLDFSQIIIVVPEDRVEEYETELIGLPVNIITQSKALGTGNAVLCAIDELLSSIKQVYVSFGTQPLVRNLTIKSSLAHHLETGVGFTIPTTIRSDPYAPLLRNAEGVVVGSVETHLNREEMPQFGETNVGGYWVSTSALNDVLITIHSNLYDEEKGVYNTKSGELGFPNEMTRACLDLGLGVEGLPIADPEEVVGLKTPENIRDIEQFLGRRSRLSGD